MRKTTNVFAVALDFTKKLIFSSAVEGPVYFPIVRLLIHRSKQFFGVDSGGIKIDVAPRHGTKVLATTTITPKTYRPP